MKKLMYNLIIFVCTVFLLTACEKNENQVVFAGGAAPVLTASLTGPLVLTNSAADDNFITFSWTNPDYEFNTGVNSQNVTYTLQADTAGSNFSNPTLSERVIPSDLSVTLTKRQLNSIANDLNLADGVPYPMEFRIKASLNNAPETVVYSNVLPFTVTYFLDTKYPVPANLYIVGNATPGGWGNPVPEPAQKFTQINPYTFQLELPMIANNFYLFLPVNGSWSAKYGAMGANGSNNPLGDDFKPEGGDMVMTAIDGTYRITVDFKLGKWTMVKL